jgi:serine/threonine-protein kinase
MSTPGTIGRYEITDRVGQGGMATVYRAVDPNFDRDVAIKVLPRAMMHDSTFRARFEREAKTIAMLEHSAIVPVYDFGEEDGQPFLVMRFMPGGSLADRLSERPLTVDEAARILTRLAPALDEAHAQGIIHRDLKPGNILFDRRGDSYIADFGIAKLSQESISLTGSATIGTPAYMSPEQARGEDTIDGRSDIYSLGAILFEMLTGRLPYNAETPMGIAVRHIIDPVPRIADLRPDLPPACDAIISRAMAKDRNRRYATAAEMAAALSAVADSLAAGDAMLPGQLPDGAATLQDAWDSLETRIDEQGERRNQAGLPRKTRVAAPAAAADEAAALPDMPAPIEQPQVVSDTARLRKRRNLRAVGITLGLVVLLTAARLFRTQIVAAIWPTYFLVISLLVVYVASSAKKAAPRLAGALVGTFFAVLSALLVLSNLGFVGSSAGDYAWTLLVPTSIGAALALDGRWIRSAKREKQGVVVVRIGLVLFAVGWVLVEVLSDATPGPVTGALWLPVLVAIGAFFFARRLRRDG